MFIPWPCLTTRSTVHILLDPGQIISHRFIAVRDTRRAEQPGGTKTLARYKYDTSTKEEALEVRRLTCVPPGATLCQLAHLQTRAGMYYYGSLSALRLCHLTDQSTPAW